jgi:hypothetical protein
MATISALVMILGITTASAQAVGLAETRVGASGVVADVLVGPPESVVPGQRLGETGPRVVTVVATGVAAETVPEVAQTGDTVLYQKLSSTGEHLKYGITKNPATR